jgi:hypothetical protein
MSPEVRVELRTIEVCAIVDHLIVAEPVPGDLTMVSTARTTTTNTCASSAVTVSMPSSSSASTVVAYT